MSSYKEIGIGPLKFENKPTTKELDEIIYELNDMLYFLANRPVNHPTQKWLSETMIELGNKVNTLQLSDTVAKRRQELLHYMRKFYNTLKTVKTEIKCTIADRESYIKVIKYQVARFLRLKDQYGEDIPEGDILILLKENKQVEKFYILPFVRSKTGTNLELKSFYSTHNELMHLWSKKYQLVDL